MSVRTCAPWFVAVLVTVAACEERRLPTATEGRMLYAENGCASCHGPDGRGDGPVAQTLDRRPRDLRDVGTFTRGVEVEAIARTLANGILVEAPATAGVNGVPPHHRQSMPKFDHLSETERQSLALYVKSFHDPTRQEAHQP